MKRTLFLSAAACAVAFVLGPSSAKAQPAPSGGTEQIITQLEQDIFAAFVKRDVATLDRIVGPEWMESFPDGATATKAQTLADLKSGVYAPESYRVDELKVKVYSDTAVVFGLETEKSTYKGRDSSGQFRFTDVFVKRNGGWQLVATHVSQVVKP